MRRILVAVIGAVVMVLGLAGCASEATLNVAPQTPSAPSVVPKTMQAFHSDAELTTYLRELAAKQSKAARISMAMVSKNPAPAAPQNSGVAGLAGADAKEESI